MIWTDKGLSSSLTQVPPTSHLSQRSVNRPPPTPPDPLPRHPTLPPSRHFAPPLPGTGGQTSHQTAATPGTWGEWIRIERAAAMRVTRVATTSDSGKATMREQPNPPPSVNSLFRSRTYAEFITDEELQRAKAEVEECYRCQA